MLTLCTSQLVVLSAIVVSAVIISGYFITNQIRGFRNIVEEESKTDLRAIIDKLEEVESSVGGIETRESKRYGTDEEERKHDREEVRKKIEDKKGGGL